LTQGEGERRREGRNKQKNNCTTFTRGITKQPGFFLVPGSSSSVGEERDWTTWAKCHEGEIIEVRSLEAGRLREEEVKTAYQILR